MSHVITSLYNHFIIMRTHCWPYGALFHIILALLLACLQPFIFIFVLFDKISLSFIYLPFLVATKRLYMSVCPSVRPSVRGWVGNAFAFWPTRSDLWPCIWPCWLTSELIGRALDPVGMAFELARRPFRKLEGPSIQMCEPCNQLGGFQSLQGGP